MNTLALLASVLPAFGAAVTFAGGRDLRHVKFWSTAPVAAALVLTLIVALDHGSGGPSIHTYSIGTAGAFHVEIGTRITGLSALTAVLVAGVAMCVQAFSTTYLGGEPRYASYAALISLFTAAMLTVVYSADLIVLLVGWEIMGACSYFLIGHYWEKPEARPASIKAFLMTKAGDVPFLFGIIALGVQAHSFQLNAVLAAAGNDSLNHPGWIAALLLCGVLGKSAQFPLHSWLPDAMAGPTPISALIHAATMVAAGIYVVALLYPVFVLAPAVLIAMAVIAAITMCGAALCAFAQTDVKKILAYSTVSQLAYMLGGLAVGGRSQAIYLLLVHGAFKALLFLAAGVVIHRIGSNELRAMGGLRFRMPITYGTMTIGLLALAGIPPFSGFFGKEGVLGAAYNATGEFAAPGKIVLIFGLITAGLTAAYALRLWLGMFHGPFPDAPREHEAKVEAPQAELIPLVLLAIPAAALGIVVLFGTGFSRVLGGWYGEQGAANAADLWPGGLTTLISLLFVLGFSALVYLAWRRDEEADPAVTLLGPARDVLLNGFYFDRLINVALVVPTRAAARFVGYFDTNVLDAYVRGSGSGARGLGTVLRRVQNGSIQFYLTCLFLGVVIMAAVYAYVGTVS
ncbi:NADH-quinone oxidoreductase subunit L [Actinospica sp.]|uniref:NADH-quinone oxidoreductase subunit 5 family protein n=1 Tax=Actinospica sp. TaxID=1872142 RepID=UPI002B741743|nr:NADH-quinone oxidoreductase subunit L [Actinospica sp.]HWG23625.1 NADH-quinone oxidoreductase subunit L [Actinospica sp.]